MRRGHDASASVDRGAEAIEHAFDAYHRAFKEITRRARSRFENREWLGMHEDARERLDVYGGVVARVVADVCQILGEHAEDRSRWAEVRAAYARLIARRADFELAETFFNSVTRRIFSTVGVDPSIEYVATDFDVPPALADAPVYRTYARGPVLTR